jgi:hypothetical protein
MTGAGTMIELTPEAEARLGEYLRQVRLALAGSPDVNPDEIEADIREHVENELRTEPARVGIAPLERVLARLGPPAQWGAGEGPSFFRRARQYLSDRLRLSQRLRNAREALWRGPENWRLAYLTFGLFATGVLVFPLFPLFLVLAYILGRSGIALAREKGIELGAARKWLLYPPVVIVSLSLLAAVLALPVIAGGVVGAQVGEAVRRVESFDRANPMPSDPRDWRAMRNWETRQGGKDRMTSQVAEDRQLLAMIPVQRDWAPAVAGLFVGAGAAALWWTLLGFAGATYPRAVRAAFVPLCNHFERRHGLKLAVPSLAVTVAWCCMAWEVVSAAGLV